jgi:hypothetical protein
MGMQKVSDKSKTTIPAVKPRRPLDDDRPDGYLESDMDWIENNMEAVVWFLETECRKS